MRTNAIKRLMTWALLGTVVCEMGCTYVRESEAKAAAEAARERGYRLGYDDAWSDLEGGLPSDVEWRAPVVEVHELPEQRRGGVVIKKRRVPVVVRPGGFVEVSEGDREEQP